jgi:hypothetical protein
VPGVPSAEELSALPAAELALRLSEAYRLTGGLTAQIERLSARVEQLERQARKDSSTSSRPPSSDSPNKKKGSDRSLRERGKRRPGKQPGGPGMTMNLADDPDETIDCPPGVCCSREMGHQQTRRTPRPVQRQRLAPAQPRTRRITPQRPDLSHHAGDAW